MQQIVDQFYFKFSACKFFGLFLFYFIFLFIFFTVHTSYYVFSFQSAIAEISCWQETSTMLEYVLSFHWLLSYGHLLFGFVSCVFKSWHCLLWWLSEVLLALLQERTLYTTTCSFCTPSCFCALTCADSSLHFVIKTGVFAVYFSL